MNKKKIHLLAQCIVNRTLGKDVRVEICHTSSNSSVQFSSNPFTNENNALNFWFGCFDEQQKNQDWYIIVVSRFPNVKTVEPALFAMLHEVGHIYAPANLTNIANRMQANTVLEYRDLPDEAFADKWASEYIAKNKMIVQVWNKQLKEALK